MKTNNQLFYQVSMLLDDGWRHNCYAKAEIECGLYDKAETYFSDLPVRFRMQSNAPTDEEKLAYPRDKAHYQPLRWDHIYEHHKHRIEDLEYVGFYGLHVETHGAYYLGGHVEQVKMAEVILSKIMKTIEKYNLGYVYKDDLFGQFIGALDKIGAQQLYYSQGKHKLMPTFSNKFSVNP